MSFMSAALAMLTVSSIVLVSCGIKPASPKPAYSYRWEKGDCQTGNHSFDSKESYCKALLDDDLNLGCAKTDREADYREKCQK